MEGKSVRSEGNHGDFPNNQEESLGGESALLFQIKLQRVKHEAQKLKTELTEKMTKEVEELFDAFVSDVEQINQSENLLQNGNVSLSSAIHRKRPEKGQLPDKVFVTRRSVLTDLFEISHIRSIYHIFVATLIVFSINTIVMDIIEKGSLGLDFELIQWGLGKFPKVMSLWMMMQLSVLLIVYPGFYYWSMMRPEGKPGLIDYVGLVAYIAYQGALLLIPIQYIYEHDLPPGSSVVVTTEQIRLMMKVHAFVRENFPKVLSFKEEESKDHMQVDMCPNFSKFLYFLFAPTLVYRDNYPRTPAIRWRYVVTNFAQVVACLFYTYYIFERFCVPAFRNFNGEWTAKAFAVSMFGCMLPGTLVLLIGFFAILHSWFNAFAEMLRFGDRMFYKDWWNSTSFSAYYRTWNIVVHDWLYTYIYKDVYKALGPKYRGVAMATVFFMSAIFHEYVIITSLKFFYPVLFTMFMGAGFGFIHVKGSSRSWNVFIWMGLFMGMGINMCLYSMEYFARQNCPGNTTDFLDQLIPRSWSCN